MTRPDRAGRSDASGVSPPSPLPEEPPDPSEVARLAEAEGVPVTDHDAEALAGLLADLLRDLKRLGIASRPESQPDSPVPPPLVRRLDPAEDPLNAFITCCDIAGAASGPLGGRRIGVKDNIDVAGVPTTNGSALPPFVPAVHAIVVERILAAGGRVVGKLNMDEFGLGSTGETSAFGPTRNPRDPTRSAGGSSGGSGAAVASGSVDAALGVDQAGSARIPASFCGVVAVKPTIGTVPTFGVTHIDRTVDSVCPMAPTVTDAARLLAVIAGPDARDGGPAEWVRREDPLAGIDLGAAGLRVGIVRESLGGADRAVVRNLRGAMDGLVRAGAVVEDVSVPVWRTSLDVARGLLCHLGAATVRGWGEVTGHLSLVDPDRLAAFASVRRNHSDRLPLYMKLWLVADAYLRNETGPGSFALLQNLRVRVRRELDDALGAFDVLVTPTTPGTAPELGRRAEVPGAVQRESVAIIANTCPINLSGHPAVAVPSGVDDEGLPTSVQVVGAWFDEPAALRAARAVERVVSGVEGWGTPSRPGPSAPRRARSPRSPG